jgi:hypothetical protein
VPLLPIRAKLQERWRKLTLARLGRRKMGDAHAKYQKRGGRGGDTMNIRRLLCAAILCGLSLPALAQRCEPTASATNHACGDGTVSTSIHVTNPCSCSATVDVKDTKHNGGGNYTVKPGGESEQALWPCGLYQDSASISYSYEFKCGKGDKNGQNTGDTGSQGSVSSGGAGGEGSTEGNDNSTNKNVQGLTAKYCRPENIGAVCRRGCTKYKLLFPSNALCAQMCAHEDAACAAANRGDASAASAEEALARQDYKREIAIGNKIQDARSEAAAKNQQQFMDNMRKEERKEAQQRAARKAAQAPTRPSQTYTQPAEADLGYPPGCRNKRAYDSCIGGQQGCSAGSRLACQPLCSDFCDDN